MAINRGRSPSLPDNEPPSKRSHIENTDLPLQLHRNAPDEAPGLVTCTRLPHCTVFTALASNVPPLEAKIGLETQSVAAKTLQTDTWGAGVHGHKKNGTMAVPLPLMEKMVVASEFERVHDSWEAFDEALKAYGKMTYQLYVIRSTTSVKRRNVKIGERDLAGNARRVGTDLSRSVERDRNPVAEKPRIPEHYQWYSKSLKCTHGWKSRLRGTGKRGSGVVRSTSCPTKMCVTLQQRGSSPDDWKVVVTKHVRTHNHPLSKELYLYYTENRRIYDPDLLAVAGPPLRSKPSVDVEGANLPSLIDPANQQPGRSRRLVASVGLSQQPQASSRVYMTPDSSFPSGTVDSHSKKQLMPHTTLAAPIPLMPPLNPMILTSGTIPSKAMDGGGFCVPRVSIKVHACWTAFHDYVAQYAFDSSQVFRTRSTVSVAARNAKMLASIAAKTGGDDHDVASDPLPPPRRLIPDACKWFSKLLICTYGWKRKGRSKVSLRGTQEDNICPAMLLARMERTVNGNWQVVINRQVTEHSHRLGHQVDETRANNHEPLGEIAEMFIPTLPFDSTAMSQTSKVDQSSLNEMPTISTQSSVNETQTLSSNPREIVVRVPRIQRMFSSWEDFHASLKIYSDATYQLYRTRTTSSVKGRNHKIAQMKNNCKFNKDTKDIDHDRETTLNGEIAARKIPESWRWYSKTLTCTHGWKERHRGTGKRNAHGVRSTACPVKICATVQYTNPSSTLKKDHLGVASKDAPSQSCWCVVVTKHVVDHNHNLSRELYQHYRENRRIYDPELLAIDTGNSTTVGTRKTGSLDLDGQSGKTADAARFEYQPNRSQLQSQSVYPMAINPGLAEAVSHAQLFAVSGHSQPTSFGLSGVSAPLATVSTSPTTVPSVVLLPYIASISCLPNQVQPLPQDLPRQQQQQHEVPTRSAIVNATIGIDDQALVRGQHIATVAPGAISPANLELCHNAEMSVPSAASPLNANVMSRTCLVHASLGGKTNVDPIDETNIQGAPCTCFRTAGGGNDKALVPTREPSGCTETNFNATQEATVYAETTGVWQPMSKFMSDNVTTESGETIWRVPRLMRRFSTWDTFHNYLDAYSIATYQLYRVRTTYSVRSRNMRLRQLAASRGLAVREEKRDDAIETEQQGDHGVSRAYLVPEEYEWYSKTFLCTHGWKRRSRGSGQRMSHNIRATKCPAKVCATLQRTDKSSSWNVVVTKHITEHNHELSEALYQQYSEVRRVRDPVILDQAEQLWRAGATRRCVFDFLKERSPTQSILMKDVHNLVQRWQTRERRSRQASDSNDPSLVHVAQQQPKAVVSSSQDDASAPWL